MHFAYIQFTEHPFLLLPAIVSILTFFNMSDSSDASSDTECEYPEVDNVDPLEPKANNVVATATIDIEKATGLKKLDFSRLIYKLDDVVYNPRQATTMRFTVRVLHQPKTLGGIFHSNGKINICGGRSVLMCREGIKKFAKRLGIALGVSQLTITNFTVTNVVATMKLPRPINVRLFKNKHGAKAEINDNRPGIKYTSMEPRFTAMIFAGGKINLMGCRSVDELPVISSVIQELTDGCLRD